jgi:hypothetical protein
MKAVLNSYRSSKGNSEIGYILSAKILTRDIRD